MQAERKAIRESKEKLNCAGHSDVVLQNYESVIIFGKTMQAQVTGEIHQLRKQLTWEQLRIDKN